MKFVAAALVASAAVAVILALEDPVPSYYGQYPKECTQVCHKNLEPVCAKNGEGRNRTYPNKCFIDYLNCRENTDFEFVSDGECPDAPLEWQNDEDAFARFDV
ncbi:turripeptide Gsg9.2 [Thrips palmi]|uniref:Turripeptide Gsg9.2 n=1 Tax=Thrips palmi TaxID=161013 RepID=A0A6P8Y7Z8_THRPL|nr:turripeptide Gsg9.2 [Thrips palmi]